MTRHRRFTDLTGVPVYFCGAHSVWQRGTIESANGLLRPYIPKGTDIHRPRRSRPSGHRLMRSTNVHVGH
ncbi:MAG: hypothetical protein M3Y04_07225 [Actinomycetota bacterium]|nr:hypothetical protein [Actinomycetota bacterium]